MLFKCRPWQSLIQDLNSFKPSIELQNMFNGSTNFLSLNVFHRKIWLDYALFLWHFFKEKNKQKTTAVKFDFGACYQKVSRSLFSFWQQLRAVIETKSWWSSSRRRRSCSPISCRSSEFLVSVVVMHCSTVWCFWDSTKEQKIFL